MWTVRLHDESESLILFSLLRHLARNPTLSRGGQREVVRAAMSLSFMPQLPYFMVARCIPPQRQASGGNMARETEVHVSQLLDEHGLSAFHIKLILWSTLIAFIDGYDIGAVAFAAPHLIQAWHVPPKSLGLVLTASNFGVLFGSQIFGWVGDRYGRKTSLIACNLLFGVFTYWLLTRPISPNCSSCAPLPGSASGA